MATAKESGFTTIEALTAMALIAVAGAILAGVSTLSIRSAQKAHDSIRTTFALIQADRSIRETASRVQTPFWANADFTDAGTDTVTARWLDGKKYGILKVEKTDDGVNIKTSCAEIETNMRVCKGFEDISIDTLNREDGVPIGICVSFSLKGKTRSILAPFASVALKKDDR